MFEMSADLGRELRLAEGDSEHSIEAEIRAEQARLFWSQSYLMAGLGLAVGVALAAAQWLVLSHSVIIGWLALLVVLSFASFGLTLYFYKHSAPTPASAQRWLYYGTVFALAHGLVWCAAAFVLFPENNFTHQAILTVMISGIAAGAVTVLSPVSVTGMAFVMPALLPLAYQYAFAGTTAAFLILAMLMVFLLTLVLSNRHLYKTLRDNIRLRIEKAHSEAALYESEARYRLMFSQSPLGVLHYDSKGDVLDCNDMIVEILGTSRKKVLGTSMIHDVADEKMVAAVRTSLQTGWAYYEDTYEPVAGINVTPLRAFFNAVTGNDEAIVGGVAIIEDFSQRKRAEEEIHRRAYYDSLTELPNRRLLRDRLDRSLTSAIRHQRFGALVFMDLDYFKRINDWLGHASGDEVLRSIAERLLKPVREEDTVARLSGDEFIILLPELSDTAKAAREGAAFVCGKLQEVLQKPLHIDGHDLRLTASLGITVFPSDDVTAEELLRQSDTAMYRGKKEVRGEIRFYEAQADAADDSQVTLEHDLQFALERNELEVLYQPIVDGDARGVGAEALLRWRHEKQGMIGPDRFISLAEENGMIIPIGRWMLAEVLERLDHLGANSPIQLSINVSAREFHHTGFVRYVEQLLQRTRVDPSRLVFEVTENVLIDRLEWTIRKMERLRRSGVRFVLDDFGTGYSSLTYLKRLPVDGVKIDRDFVRDLETDPSDAAIVEAVVTIAHRLGLYVVAEGIERTTQRDFLLEYGCDRFQGFLWREPTPFETLFRRRGGRQAADNANVWPGQGSQ